MFVLHKHHLPCGSLTSITHRSRYGRARVRRAGSESLFRLRSSSKNVRTEARRGGGAWPLNCRKLSLWNTYICQTVYDIHVHARRLGGGHYIHLPKHLQDGPPQCCPLGGWVSLTGTEKHRVVCNDAHGRWGGKEMVQISARNRAELLLQVGTLRLWHTGSHWQSLQEKMLKCQNRNIWTNYRQSEWCGMKGFYSFITPNTFSPAKCPDWGVCVSGYNICFC